MVLDLPEVTFIDAVGLRHIEHAQLLLRSRGHSLRIVQPTSPVRRLFTASARADLLPA